MDGCDTETADLIKCHGAPRWSRAWRIRRTPLCNSPLWREVYEIGMVAGRTGASPMRRHRPPNYGRQRDTRHPTGGPPCGTVQTQPGRTLFRSGHRRTVMKPRISKDECPQRSRAASAWGRQRPHPPSFSVLPYALTPFTPHLLPDAG